MGEREMEKTLDGSGKPLPGPSAPGDPFEFAGNRFGRAVDFLTAEIIRFSERPACEWCGFTYVHAHNCLDKMNARRTPTGDWWKL